MAYLFSDICASHINAYSVYSATVVFACLAEQPLKAPPIRYTQGWSSRFGICAEAGGEHALCTRPGHITVSVISVRMVNIFHMVLVILRKTSSASSGSGDH